MILKAKLAELGPYVYVIDNTQYYGETEKRAAKK